MTIPGDTQRNWKPCQPGELSNFASQQRLRQRRKLMAKVGIAGGLMLMFAIVATQYCNSLTMFDASYGGITCTEVRAHAKDFMMGKLDTDTADRVQAHLKQCSMCQAFLKKMFPADKQARHDFQPADGLDCDCTACTAVVQRRMLAGN